LEYETPLAASPKKCEHLTNAQRLFRLLCLSLRRFEFLQQLPPAYLLLLTVGLLQHEQTHAVHFIHSTTTVAVGTAWLVTRVHQLLIEEPAESPHAC